MSATRANGTKLLPHRTSDVSWNALVAQSTSLLIGLNQRRLKLAQSDATNSRSQPAMIVLSHVCHRSAQNRRRRRRSNVTAFFRAPRSTSNAPTNDDYFIWPSSISAAAITKRLSGDEFFCLSSVLGTSDGFRSPRHLSQIGYKGLWRSVPLPASSYFIYFPPFFRFPQEWT